MLERQKRGQVTIFVIIAIVIVAGIVIFFVASDSGRQIFENFGEEVSVERALRECIQDNLVIEETVDQILLQGGALEPQFYYTYQGNNIEYLCHTSEFYQTCFMQKPLLFQYVESEIKQGIAQEVEGCVQSVEARLKSQGYTTNNADANLEVELISNNVLIQLDYPLTISKEGSQRFEDFEFRVSNRAYQLISMSTSILNYEARFGDADPLQYMILYPNVRVEKLKQSEGSTIYILTDRKTDDKFQFAVRSLAWPPGYDL